MLQSLLKITSQIEQSLKNITERFEVKDKKLRKVISVFFFVTVLHVIYSYTGIYQHILERPCSIHASAQCQRASVALNYYNVDMNFFLPRIQRFNKDDGITGLEFPIIYYSAAILYKIFGFHDFYLRVISLLILSLGIIFFYLLVNRFIKSSIVSSIVVCSVILSPVLLYYSANFMPDAPALGFTIMAWYYFFRYLDAHKNKYLNLFVFFGTLGALIKAVSAMSFFIAIVIVIIDRFKPFKKSNEELVFKKRSQLLTRTVFGLLVVFVWYVYAHWLTEYHGNAGFSMIPMIVKDAEGFQYVMKYLQNWIFQYYSYETYFLLVVAAIFTVLNFRKANRMLLTITVLYFGACISYVYLFFNQFAHHDYYFIAILPFVFFLVLTFVDSLSRLAKDHSRTLMLVFSIIMLFNLKECLLKCKENYFTRFDSKENFGGDYRPYYDLEPKLRALGISRTDKFVSAFDDSYSNSLYYMNQPGFTVESMYQRDTILHALNAPGVRYLVVNDSAKFNRILLQDLAKQIVIIHRGLIVYKLK